MSDASADQTDDIVQRITRKDPRTKLIKKQERKGKNDSINLVFMIPARRW
ncbi:hypothetical protein ACFLWG_00485 [Chloroflexota bacterium]